MSSEPRNERDATHPEPCAPAGEGAAPGVDPASLCPSCGRFVGPKTRCPFCGASIHARLSLHLFRWGSVAVALLGLLFLYLWAVNRDISKVKIGELVETMNMAYVEVSGTVGNVSAYRDEKDRMEYLTFELDDGSSRLPARIKAYRSVAMALDEQGRLPRRGDKAQVAGSVRFAETGQVELMVQTAEHVRIEKEPAERVELADLDLSLLGETIRVEGRVDAVYAPREGSKAPYKVRLRDEEADAYLVLWSNLYAPLEARGLKEGALVRARVAVGEHRGKLQLTPADASDVEIASAPKPPREETPETPEPPVPQKRDGRLAPGDVGRSLLGTWVDVAGEVVDVERFRSGMRIVLQGGGGTVESFLHTSLLEHAEEAASVARGARISVHGRVEEYKGTLQVNPDSPDDLALLAEGEAERSEVTPPSPRTAASLSAQDAGSMVVLTGEIAALKTISKGTKVILDDGSGKTVVVLLWDSIRRKLRDAAIVAVGRKVRVVGEVGTYQGEVQVEPQTELDFVAVE